VDVRAITWRNHARTRLEDAGLRSGGAREEVVTLLGEQSCCLSAQEIHDELRKRERGVGIASVYRALETLANLGLVHRVDVGGVACFEPADPSGEHHHHAICSECGRRAAFEDPELERLLDRAGQKLGYAVEAHDLVLHGTCPDCVKS
jgi:Fur family transcriptional regulator, ferric uptake regulator